MKFKFGITARLALLFIGFAIVVLVGIGTAAYLSGRNALEAAVRSDLLSVALEKHTAFESWITERQAGVSRLAGSPAIVADWTALIQAAPGSAVAQAAHDRLVNELQVRIGAGQPYLEASILEPSQGQIVVSTDRVDEGKIDADRPYFINGKLTAYTQNIYYALDEQGPSIVSAAPLRSADGRLLGVLTGRLDLNELNAIIGRRTGLQQTDESFLVNTSNLFVTQPRFISDPAVLQRGIHTLPLKHCLAEESGSLLADDYRGVPVIAQYDWIPARQLCLIVKIDQTEAFAPVTEFGAAIVIVGLALLGIASILALSLARSFTRPVRALQSRTAQIGRGDTSLRLPEHTRDEFGLLAHEFNTMAAAISDKETQLRNYTADLEQRVQARTVELQTSEASFRYLFVNNPHPMWVYDLETLAFLEVNDTAVDRYGYTRSEFLHMKITDIRPPEDVARLVADVQPKDRPAIERSDNWRHRLKDGRIIDVEILSHTLEFGGLHAVLVVAHDITDRKRAEATRDQLAAIVASSEDAIIGETLDGTITSWNKGAEKVYGYAREDVVGQPISILIPTDLPNELSAILVRLNMGESIEGYETTRVRKEGQRINVALTISPIRDSTGNITGASTIARNITDRKQAEEALLASEARYRHTLNAMLEGCQIIGFDWRYLYLNDVADKHNRRPKAELLGKKYMEMWPGIEATEVFAVIRRCMEEREPQSMETKFIFPDGGTGWFELRIYPVPEGSVIFSIDVTERKGAEEEIQTLNAELEQRVIERTAQLEAANKELESFSYSISHDLRAPLRAIDGFSRILVEDFSANLPPDLQRYLQLIRGNAGQMGHLIDDLLQFSRLNRQPLNKQMVKPMQVVREALRALQPEQAVHQPRIIIGELLECEADPALLKQVWINLLSNAIKYTRKQAAPQIEVGFKYVDGATVYFVRDNGAGFDMQYAHKLFGVFQRLHRAEDYEGTGVGLAIVQRIIERHGGRIWAEAMPNVGATFYFTL